jgi:hypothetical protein
VGAAGAEGATAALANVDPLGDWMTQTADSTALFEVLGDLGVKLMADEGDRNAQYSMGILLMDAAGAKARAGLQLADDLAGLEIKLYLCS